MFTFSWIKWILYYVFVVAVVSCVPSIYIRGMNAYDCAQNNCNYHGRRFAASFPSPLLGLVRVSREAVDIYILQVLHFLNVGTTVEDQLSPQCLKIQGSS